MIKKLYAILLFFFVSLHFSFSQDQVVQTSISTDSILIGEQFSYQYFFSYDIEKESKIQLPLFADTLGGKIEIVKKLAVDTIIGKNKQQKRIQQKLILTSFQKGIHYIPALKIVIDEKTYIGDGHQIEVKEPIIAENEAIKDIKDIIELELSIWDWLMEHKYWIFFILSILSILSFILYKMYINRKKLLLRPKKKIQKEKLIPPHIIALDALQKLEKRDLCRKEKYKLHYSFLTEIIKNYLEARFQINILDKTTNEIISEIGFVDLSLSSKEDLKKVLSIADFVKFAKYKPLSSNNENCMAWCKKLIAVSSVKEETIIKETE